MKMSRYFSDINLYKFLKNSVIFFLIWKKFWNIFFEVLIFSYDFFILNNGKK